MIIGAAVTKSSLIPKGMVSAVIPHSQYARFSSEKGNPEAVGKTWQQIWGFSKNDAAFAEQRTYHTEIEHYQANGKY